MTRVSKLAAAMAAGVIVLTGAVPSHGGDPAPRVVIDPFSGWSGRIPPGWDQRPAAPEEVSMILLGPVQPPFRSNIVVTVEYLDGTIEAYRDGILAQESHRGARVRDPIAVGDQKALIVENDVSARLLPLRIVQALVPLDRRVLVVTGTSLRNRAPALEEALRSFLGSLKTRERAPWPTRLQPIWVDPRGRFALRPPQGFRLAPGAEDDALLLGPWEGGRHLRLGIRMMDRNLPDDPDALRRFLVHLRLDYRFHRSLEFPLEGRLVRYGRRVTVFMVSRRREGEKDLARVSLLIPLRIGAALQVVYSLPEPALPVHREALEKSLQTLVMGPVDREGRPVH